MDQQGNWTLMLCGDWMAYLNLEKVIAKTITKRSCDYKCANCNAAVFIFEKGGMCFDDFMENRYLYLKRGWNIAKWHT